MPVLKNIRHEHFIRRYIQNGGNGADAYRYIAAMFQGRPLTNPKSATICARWVLKRPEVRKREMEIREIMTKKSDITIEKILTDYQWALDAAKAKAEPNNVINAATAQAKLTGLLRERIETGGAGEFEGMENISEILEKLAQEEGPEAALLAAKMLGLDAGKEAEKDNGESGLIDQPSPSDAVN